MWLNGRALAGATAKSAAPDGELERLASLVEHIAREELDVIVAKMAA